MPILDIYSGGGAENRIDIIIQWMVDNDETEAAEVIRYLKFRAEDNHKIVKRIWSILDLSYDDLNGRSIYEVIEDLKAGTQAYRAGQERMRARAVEALDAFMPATQDTFSTQVCDLLELAKSAIAALEIEEG